MMFAVKFEPQDPTMIQCSHNGHNGGWKTKTTWFELIISYFCFVITHVSKLLNKVIPPNFVPGSVLKNMYQQESGNLIASWVMGQQRFLQVVRQQNQGTAAGQDTDETMEERAEFEEQEDDPPVAPVPAGDQEGPTTALVVGRRKEINHALARNHFRDAAKMQHLVLPLLDNLNAGNMGRTVERDNILREVANRLESIAPRHQIMTPELANRLRQRTMEIRGMMWWTIERKIKDRNEGNLGDPL